MKVKELRISPISHRNSLNATSSETNERAKKYIMKLKI